MRKMMTFAVMVAMCFAAVSFAQTKKIDEKMNSVLWEISGNGLKESSFVLGTFHMMCEKDFQIKPKVFGALKKVQKVVFEIDYSNPKEIVEMQKMMLSEKKLSEQLSVDDANELNEILKAYGTTLEAVDDYSVQSLYSILGMKVIPCPQEEIRMYEIELLKIALKEGKAVGGLEKVVDQLAFLGKSYNLKEAMRQLKLGQAYEELSKEMIKGYINEDLVVLDKLLKDVRFMSVDQERWMLTERNIQWVDKDMPEMMSAGSVLFGVGSGHLMGDNGVVALLRERGYTVKPVY